MQTRRGTILIPAGECNTLGVVEKGELGWDPDDLQTEHLDAGTPLCCAYYIVSGLSHTAIYINTITNTETSMLCISTDSSWQIQEATPF